MHSWLCLEPVAALYDQSIARLDRYIRKIKDSIGFDGPLLNGIIESRNEVNQAFYANIFYHVDPDIERANLFLISEWRRSGHASFWVDIYKNLNEKEGKSFNGKTLKEFTKLCIGQPFPEFVLPTPEGKTLSLKEVVVSGKVTLVHFWAANSFEKKDYQDELRILYQKYHVKGLNIIGFSSDKYAEEWRDNVQKEHYPWYNVSDSKGIDGMVDKVYHEFGDSQTHNTTNVLIDSQGKIIAWDVRGAELQWYLWKYLGQ
jgi:peroxiredoxin